MANQTQLADWIAENAKSLSLQIQVSDWTGRYLPGYTDARAVISLYGKSFAGRAVAKDEDDAAVRAVAEAIERTVCYEHNVGSSGVAVHTDLDRARTNSKNELIERDRILCHHLTKTPAAGLVSSLPDHIQNGVQAFQQDQVTIKFLRLRRIGETESILAVARLKGGGLILGGGAGPSVEPAVEKAAEECFLNAAAFLADALPRPLALNEFAQLPSPQPIDHLRLYLHPDTALHIPERASTPDVQTEAPPDVEFEILEFEHPLLESCPLRAVRAESKNLLPVFWGTTTLNKVDVPRLQSFVGDEVLKINTFPHPVA